MAGLFDRLQDEIDSRDENSGLSPIDLLDLPEALSEIVNKIVRNNGMKLEDIAAELGKPPADTESALNELVDKGFVRKVQVKDDVWYKARFARKADKSLSSNIWSALGGAVDDD